MTSSALGAHYQAKLFWMGDVNGNLIHENGTTMTKAPKSLEQDGVHVADDAI